MRPDYSGLGPVTSAPEAASSARAAGASPVVADAFSPAGLEAQNHSIPAAEAAQSRGSTELGNLPTSASNAHKAFLALVALLALLALLALKSHVLTRTHGDGGPVRFYVTRLGLVRELPDMAAGPVFTGQVGAAHA